MNGTKTWVVNGSKADVYVVLAQTEKDSNAVSQDKLSVMLVNKNVDGIKIEKCNPAGLRGADICNVTFQNTPVPVGRSNRL